MLLLIFLSAFFFYIVCQVEHNDYNKWPCECSVNISDLTASHDNPTTENLEVDESANTSASTAPPTDILKECMYGFFINQKKLCTKQGSKRSYFLNLLQQSWWRNGWGRLWTWGRRLPHVHCSLLWSFHHCQRP